jgi:hypothetical protein
MSVSADLWVALPARRFVSGSALGSGALRWFLRDSVRSASGLVLVAVFASPASAGTFASRWAGRVPGLPFVAARRVPEGWAVSVPVAPAP